MLKCDKVLIFDKYSLQFQPVVARKSSFPVPIELIAVVLGTVISKYCKLPELYNITTVGEIPRG